MVSGLHAVLRVGPTNFSAGLQYTGIRRWCRIPASRMPRLPGIPACIDHAADRGSATRRPDRSFATRRKEDRAATQGGRKRRGRARATWLSSAAKMRRTSWYAPPTIVIGRERPSASSGAASAGCASRARQRRERRDRRAVAVVEREALGGRRAERARERGVVRARHGVLRVREALQPRALGRPDQQARGVEIEAAHGAQLGVERRLVAAARTPSGGARRRAPSRSPWACAAARARRRTARAARRRRHGEGQRRLSTSRRGSSSAAPSAVAHATVGDQVARLRLRAAEVQREQRVQAGHVLDLQGSQDRR